MGIEYSLVLIYNKNGKVFLVLRREGYCACIRTLL